MHMILVWLMALGGLGGTSGEADGKLHWLGAAAPEDWNAPALVARHFQSAYHMTVPTWWLNPDASAAEVAAARAWLAEDTAAPRQLVVTAPHAREWGIEPEPGIITGLTNGEQAWKFPAPLEVWLSPAPESGTTLLYDGAWRDVVWRYPVQPNRTLVYCGLPFGQVAADDPVCAALDGATADFFAMLGLRFDESREQGVTEMQP